MHHWLTFCYNNYCCLQLLPSALAVAIEEDKDFRQGLPLDYLQYMGVTHSDKEAEPRREAFMNKVHDLIDKLFSKAPIDAAVDQFGKQLMHDALPPRLESGKLDLRCSVCQSCQNKIKML